MEKDASAPKRIWRVKPSKEAWQQAKTGKLRWMPEQLSLKEGIRQTAIPVLVGYCLILAGNLWNIIRSAVLLPQTVLLPVHFGLSNIRISGAVLALVLLGIQMYFIYRELIRKVFTKTLLLVPAMYFVIETAVVSQLLRAAGCAG